MTGPTDPEDPEDSGDWAFPEVAGPEPAGPASVDLPAVDEGQYDTGSDAWWRAQAEAQRRAAQHDPVVQQAAAPVPPMEPPPDLVEPEVLQPGPPAASNPLDRDWLPPDLAEPTVAYAGDPEPSPEPEPVPEPQPVYAAPESPATRPPHEPARVGPARAVAGAALAIAGVAVGIGALLWAGSDEPKGSPVVRSLATERSTPSPTPTPSPTVSPTPSPAGKPTPVATTPVAQPAQAPIVPVSVLNNSRIKGLADRAATRFRAGGWPVPVTGNYRGGIIATTTVYFAPGQQASAQRFAKLFGIPRVAPRFSGLPTRGMTVVLTRDYR